MAEETKVEMESVPLKSDTDAPAADSPETTEAAPAPPKKTWFFKKAKKASEPSDEDKAAEEKLGDDEKPKKKKCWWNREKSEGEQKSESISIGINLVERDEKNINEHVKFGFEDIFGEPDSTHSWDCAWRLTFRVFTAVRQFVYRLLALIVGLPAALVFGILFAVAAVLNVFACVPLAKLLSIPGNWLAKAWAFIVHGTLDPLARSVGLLFSSVSVRKYGINQDTTSLA